MYFVIHLELVFTETAEISPNVHNDMCRIGNFRYKKEVPNPEKMS